MKVKRQPREKVLIKKSEKEINLSLQNRIESLEKQLRDKKNFDNTDIDIIVNNLKKKHSLEISTITADHSRELQKALTGKKNDDIKITIRKHEKKIMELNSIISQQKSIINLENDISTDAISKKRKKSTNFDKMLTAISDIYLSQKSDTFFFSWETAESKYNISRSRISAVIDQAVKFEIVSREKDQETRQLKLKILRVDWI